MGCLSLQILKDFSFFKGILYLGSWVMMALSIDQVFYPVQIMKLLEFSIISKSTRWWGLPLGEYLEFIV